MHAQFHCTHCNSYKVKRCNQLSSPITICCCHKLVSACKQLESIQTDKNDGFLLDEQQIPDFKTTQHYCHPIIQTLRDLSSSDLSQNTDFHHLQDKHVIIFGEDCSDNNF